TAQITVVTLPVVLVSEKIVARLPCILKRARAVSQFEHFTPVKHSQDVRQISIARVGQFIQSELPIRFPRTSADERQFAVGRPMRVPLKKMIDFRGLTVFINAKDANV